MLGLLLARAGVDVVVLEKHPDFFRDFRGNTVHASTLQILDDLDLTEAFARVPQQRTTRINLMTDDGMTAMGDFTELPGRSATCPWSRSGTSCPSSPPRPPATRGSHCTGRSR